MAIVEKPTAPLPLPKYEQIAVTKQELDWADLVTLDLSDFENEGGKDRLAKQLFDAVQNIGFFYVRSSLIEWTVVPLLTTWSRLSDLESGRMKSIVNSQLARNFSASQWKKS